eukprot:9878422-Alexandrium_andersonii.AAC.1
MHTDQVRLRRAVRGRLSGGQGATALASLAFAESVMLHCVRPLQQGRGSGGKCVESSGQPRER